MSPMFNDWRTGYYAEDEPSRGIERTCFHCGERTFVSPSEPYQVQVWCDRCLQHDDDRDSRHLPCRCHDVHPQNCPRHGIAASNARENRFWQRTHHARPKARSTR